LLEINDATAYNYHKKLFRGQQIMYSEPTAAVRAAPIIHYKRAHGLSQLWLLLWLYSKALLHAFQWFLNKTLKQLYYKYKFVGPEQRHRTLFTNKYGKS